MNPDGRRYREKLRGSGCGGGVHKCVLSCVRGVHTHVISYVGGVHTRVLSCVWGGV